MVQTEASQSTNRGLPGYKQRLAEEQTENCRDTNKGLQQRNRLLEEYKLRIKETENDIARVTKA